MAGVRERVFESTDKFWEHYFSNYCKRYPITIRVSEEEQKLIHQFRGGKYGGCKGS